MTINQLHDKVTKHVRVDKSIEEFKDEVIAIDIAPYVIKAFFADAPAIR